MYAFKTLGLSIYYNDLSPSSVSLIHRGRYCVNKVANGTLPWATSLDANQHIQGRQCIQHTITWT